MLLNILISFDSIRPSNLRKNPQEGMELVVQNPQINKPTIYDQTNSAYMGPSYIYTE